MGLWFLGCSQQAQVFGGCSLDPEQPVGLPQAQGSGSRLEAPRFAGRMFWKHLVLQQPPPAAPSPGTGDRGQGRDTPGEPGLSLGCWVAWLTPSSPQAGAAPSPAPQPPLVPGLTFRWFCSQSRLCGGLSPKRHRHLCCKPRSREGEDAEFIAGSKGKGGKDNTGLVR